MEGRRARASGAEITRASRGHVGRDHERLPSKCVARRTPGACPGRETLVWRDLVKMGCWVPVTARGPASPRRAPPATYRSPPNEMVQGYKRRPHKVRSAAGSGWGRSTSESTGGGHPPASRWTPPRAPPARHTAPAPRAPRDGLVSGAPRAPTRWSPSLRWVPLQGGITPKAQKNGGSFLEPRATPAAVAQPRRAPPSPVSLFVVGPRV